MEIEWENNVSTLDDKFRNDVIHFYYLFYLPYFQQFVFVFKFNMRFEFLIFTKSFVDNQAFVI